MLVHHMGKSMEAGLRGSSAARAGADFALAITCPRDETTGNTGKRQLALTKSRSGKEGPLADVTLQEVPIGNRLDGTVVTSAVLHFVPYAQVGTKPSKGRPAGHLAAARDAFNEVSLKSGMSHKVGSDGPEVRAVKYNDLFQEFEARSLESADTEEPEKTAKRIKRALNDVLSPANGFASHGKGADKKVWQTTSAVSAIMHAYAPNIAA